MTGWLGRLGAYLQEAPSSSQLPTVNVSAPSAGARMRATVPKYSGVMVVALGLYGTKSNIQINWMPPEFPIFRFSRVGIFALWYGSSRSCSER
jgi:hypothetical protein